MGVAHSLLAPKLKQLDRPAWSALSIRHAGFCHQVGSARLYRDTVAPFAAFDPDSDPGSERLADVVARRQGGIAFMQAESVGTPHGLVGTLLAEGVQMVLTRELASPPPLDLVSLSRRNVAEMSALVAQTEPGPFKSSTIDFGGYWGVFRQGRLVAMAGQRMRPEGFCEISAVCVAPDFRGQGFARALVTQVARGILERGEIPFLHTYADNAPAIQLYSDMGFRLHQAVHIACFDVPERSGLEVEQCVVH